MQLIHLTDAAADRVRALMARAEKPVFGLRIGVRARGCSGMSYVVEYADAPAKGEDVVTDKGVAVCIDPKAVMFLVGTEVDYVEGQLESGFVFRNPNEKARCGCGESFTV